MSVKSFRSAFLLAALVLGAATFPSSLSPQQGATDDRDSLAAQVSLIPTSAPVATDNPASAAGPRNAPAGFTRTVATSLPGPARPISDARMGDNANVAMMAIGAAAIGLGLIIGGDGGTVIAVTGGVIGLTALYRYLR
jgi:hypothetical protein